MFGINCQKQQDYHEIEVRIQYCRKFIELVAETAVFLPRPRLVYTRYTWYLESHK
jgi:hypothetical protein